MLLEFLNEFVGELETQLTNDQERWGDTWMHRPREEQEDRIMADINDYYDQYQYAGTPMPWLKIAGLALIGWVRENHPEVLRR